MLLILLPGLDGSGLLYDDFRAALGSEMALQVLVYPADLALTYSELAASLRKALPNKSRGCYWPNPLPVRWRLS